MTLEHTSRRRRRGLVISVAMLAAAVSMPAQQMVTETRDSAQVQDEDFARAVKEWTTQPYYVYVGAIAACGVALLATRIRSE